MTAMVAAAALGFTGRLIIVWPNRWQTGVPATHNCADHAGQPSRYASEV